MRQNLQWVDTEAKADTQVEVDTEAEPAVAGESIKPGVKRSGTPG